MLVSEWSTGLTIYSPSGTVKRHLARPEMYGIQIAFSRFALMPDEQSVWAVAAPFCDTGHLLRISLDHGRLLAHGYTSVNEPSGFVVAAAAHAIPTASETGLLALATALALAAVFLLKR